MEIYLIIPCYGIIKYIMNLVKAIYPIMKKKKLTKTNQKILLNQKTNQKKNK